MRTLLTLCRVAGAVLGVTAAVAVVADGRQPRATGVEPLRIAFAVHPSGEVLLGRDGRLGPPAALRPGSPPAGAAVRVTNASARPLRLRVRARPPRRPDADRLVTVHVAAGAVPLYAGSLHGLRRFTARAVVLPAGATRRLRVEARLPGGVAGGWAARRLAVTLEVAA